MKTVLWLAHIDKHTSIIKKKKSSKDKPVQVCDWGQWCSSSPSWLEIKGAHLQLLLFLSLTYWLADCHSESWLTVFLFEFIPSTYIHCFLGICFVYLTNMFHFLPRFFPPLSVRTTYRRQKMNILLSNCHLIAPNLSQFSAHDFIPTVRSSREGCTKSCIYMLRVCVIRTIIIIHMCMCGVLFC